MCKRWVLQPYYYDAQQFANAAIQIFKIVLSKAFDLRCTIPEIENVGEPLLLYQSVG